MNCTAPDMDKYRQHGQPPNIEEITRHAPNMDNMDNVDNRPAAGKEEAAPALFFCRVCLFVQQETKTRKQPPAPPRGAASTQPALNIDNVDNMDTTARRVEATQTRGGEYRKSKRPPPTNRERPKPQIKNERPKEHRAFLPFLLFLVS